MSKENEKKDHVYTGTVAWFNIKRKFGFIIPDDKEENAGDLFVHSDGLTTEVIKTDNDEEKEVPIKINKDDRVSYVIGEAEENQHDKPVALEVKKIDEGTEKDNE